MDAKRLVAILLIIGAILIGISVKNKVTSKEFSEEDLTKVSKGNIQVTAIFLNPKYPEMAKATFYVRLDTHSGDLYRYDMMDSITLQVDRKTFRPVSWKEDEKSWEHHRYGFMEFPEEALRLINSKMEFRLLINIDGERVLEWKA